MDFTHVVVDGSNIATESRSTPSLRQLDEAVRAFAEEYGIETITVIVDATFGHRIDPEERAEFDEAIDNAELITPPAGAIGRGDAFVLEVADRAGATVLSNDSFQEFHGEHTWLFDEGRLIGGKPVPGVGWIFLYRTPVRGVTSRRSTRDAKRKEAAKKTPSKKASSKKEPSKKTAKKAAKKATKKTPAKEAPPRDRRPRTDEVVNEPLPFIEFVGEHPVGSELTATIERYTSHGAYALAGGARCYLPLSAMGDPPPQRARDVVSVGGDYSVIVEEIHPARRSIDVRLASPEAVASSTNEPPKRRRRRRGGDKKPANDQPTERVTREHEDAKDTTTLDSAGTTIGAEPTREEAPVTPAKKTARKKPARKAAKKSPAKKRATKKAAKRAPAKKATKKRATKKAAKKRPAKKRATKKAAKKRPAKKRATKKAAKKRPAKKRATKKAAKKRPAKKRATKKAAKKRPAKKKAAARRR